MKLPFIFFASGGGNSYHETPFDQVDIDGENQDDIGNENTPEITFEEYLWMENEEEFDKIEMQRLEEEALMNECMENIMQDDDEHYDVVESENSHWIANDEAMRFDYTDVELFKIIDVTPHDIENSNLNPLAQEFYPTSGRLK